MKPPAPARKKRRTTQTSQRGAGSASLRGYEYQIDVSVWLALDLVLANRLALEAVLEPRSQEDLEADLQDNEPGRTMTTVPMAGYKLVVQAKHREDYVWTVKAFAGLLGHGSDGRPSAAKRLADSSCRYLLVTSAALNSGVKDFGIRRAGNWPKGVAMPASLKTILPVGATDRVAIIGRQDEERLAIDIQRLLTVNFRVPNARWEQCRHALREEARLRIRGGCDGRWQRADLEELIRKHEGSVAASPELEHYVHPTNWGDLTSAMTLRHAALIIGQSGTGKTLATRKLFEELRDRIPGLSRVPITLGPHQLLNDATPPPVLYDIEDPWGRYDFNPDSRPWNDQLSQCFEQARHDRMIVATSRRDVAQASRALGTVSPWVVGLEAEHYGRVERQQLYRTRIDGLPRLLQPIAVRAEAQVLRDLATPLEIQKFFDALAQSELGGRVIARRLVAEAIGQAHHRAIERTVIEQIKQRNDIHAAAVVWALLKANAKLSLRTLRKIEEGLADRHPAFEKGVEPLVAFFVAARNLRQNDDEVSYYHPRVESGIEQALDDDRLLARKALRLLLEVLVSADGPAQEWGTEVAVRILSASARREGLKPTPSPTAQTIIDTWLSGREPHDGQAFESFFRQAAEAGSTSSIVSELARFMLYQRDSPMGFLSWEPPHRNEDWYGRLRANSATPPLLDAFVREVLPTIRMRYPSDFASILRLLAPSLTDAFLAAAHQVVNYGVIDSCDAIAEGALDDISGFETVVDAALSVLTPSEVQQERNEQERLAIINGEYSEEYAEHLTNDDEGHTAGELLKAYVVRVRRTLGWRRIAEHRHADRLLYYWLRDLFGQGLAEAPHPDELDRAVDAAYGHAQEGMAWRLLQQWWQPRYFDRLVARIKAGHHDADVREAALACLAKRAPEQLTNIVYDLTAGGAAIQAATIAVDLAELHAQNRHPDDDEALEAIEAAMARLPVPLDATALAASEVRAHRAPVVTADMHTYVAALSGGDVALRRFRVSLDRHAALPVDEDIRWLLAHADDDAVAAEAVDAAARRGMTAELDAALDHRFARASARALHAIAAHASAPLPARLLRMADAKGSPIRTALVEVLADKPHPAHLPALLRLAADSWTTSWTSHGEESRFPIARLAVAAIAQLGPPAADTSERLWSIAVETADPKLRVELFELIAKRAEDLFRDRLFDIATSPGRTAVREAAALALLVAYTQAQEALVGRISPELLTRLDPTVAARLTLLWSLRAAIEPLVLGAGRIAAKQRRRALILLIIWVLKERDPDAAAEVTQLLPAGHMARRWARDEDEVVMDDATLADLGDPLIVEAVLGFVVKENK